MWVREDLFGEGSLSGTYFNLDFPWDPYHRFPLLLLLLFRS